METQKQKDQMPPLFLYVAKSSESSKAMVAHIEKVNLKTHILIQDVSTLSRPLPTWLDGVPLLVDRRLSPPQCFIRGGAAMEHLLRFEGEVQAAAHETPMVELFRIPKVQAPDAVRNKYLANTGRGAGISEALEAMQGRRAPPQNAPQTLAGGALPASFYED